jgi:glycosyltransferase involved in cell wall biosynthesis
MLVLEGESEMLNTAVESQVSAVVAAALYQRGAVSLAEASRLAAMPEDLFLEAVATAEKAAPDAAARPAPASGSTWELRLLPQFKLSVLIPVYNERQTIREILQRVDEVALPKEIIVVDDGSRDGTREVLREIEAEQRPNLRIHFHERNRGKGAAVRTAIAQATGTVCLIQDADLEYDPREYPQLLQPILDGRADAVYGSRFIGGGAHRVHLFWHYLGNQALTKLSNMLTNLNLTDMETCYKVARTELLKSLTLRANKFEIEPELTAKLAKARARIYEVPISYSGRDYAEGKKIGWRDGVQAIWCIIKFRFWD